MIPQSNHYWLVNARVPTPLMVRSRQGRSRDWLVASDSRPPIPGDFLSVDLEIVDGFIASIATAGTLTHYNAPSVNLRDGIVFPCFADIHTHLDKGQIWERASNPDGTFASAIDRARKDAETYWNSDDLYRRMEFGLKCSYAHGTKALRTHLDAGHDLAEISLEVFQVLQQEWQGRLILQPVCLTPLDYFLTPQGEVLADQMAELGGILGGVTYMNPDITAQIDRAFTLAKERKLSLDFHTDENGDPSSTTLYHIAEAAIRHHYQGKVICGHCCSLAVQEPQEAKKTIALVKKAGIGVVSLPMCNLYLQDRKPGSTPYWRGITLLHELQQAGVPVAIASDNCRDPFHSFGDHDALEVFSLSVKIAHLDSPYGNWCRTITMTPADLMGLPTVGRIGVGLPADLVLFRARSYSELLSRSQRDRIVLREGREIDTTLPDYAELDDLLMETAR